MSKEISTFWDWSSSGSAPEPVWLVLVCSRRGRGWSCCRGVRPRRFFSGSPSGSSSTISFSAIRNNNICSSDVYNCPNNHNSTWQGREKRWDEYDARIRSDYAQGRHKENKYQFSELKRKTSFSPQDTFHDDRTRVKTKSSSSLFQFCYLQSWWGWGTLMSLKRMEKKSLCPVNRNWSGWS